MDIYRSPASHFSVTDVTDRQNFIPSSQTAVTVARGVFGLKKLVLLKLMQKSGLRTLRVKYIS